MNDFETIASTAIDKTIESIQEVLGAIHSVDSALILYDMPAAIKSMEELDILSFTLQSSCENLQKIYVEYYGVFSEASLKKSKLESALINTSMTNLQAYKQELNLKLQKIKSTSDSTHAFLKKVLGEDAFRTETGNKKSTYNKRGVI